MLYRFLSVTSPQILQWSSGCDLWMVAQEWFVNGCTHTITFLKMPYFFLLRLQFWSLSAAGCHTGMFSLSKNHLHFLPFHSLILSWWLMMVAFVHISFRWQGYFCSYMYFITSICTTVRYKDLHSKCINLSLLKYKTSSCHLTHFQFRII